MNQEAEIWALFEEGVSGYRHFFLMVDGMALDIRGHMKIEEMKLTFAPDYFPAKKVDLNALFGAMKQNGDREADRIVAVRIEKHLKENREKFERRSSL